MRIGRTVIVERPRPVPKGLRHTALFTISIMYWVERPRPVPKGLFEAVLKLNKAEKKIEFELDKKK